MLKAGPLGARHVPPTESRRDSGGVNPPGPPLLAVIFDVDGVLVQSMERHHEAYQRLLRKEGIDIAQHEVYAQEGRRSREVIESIAKERGLDFSPEKLDDLAFEKQQIFAGFGPQPFYPGVRELIDRLHEKGLRTAMVTGTNRANVENHFGDFVRRFDAIITADDVKHTKPHPEPYLAALKALDVEATQAVVVENAVLGIRAGKAAGMRVIAITSTLSAEELHEADLVIDDVAQVDRALEELG